MIAVVRGLQQQVIVGAGHFGVDPPAPAHAEMEDHRRPAIKMHQPVFGAAREGADRGAGHHLHQIGGEGAAQVGPVQRDARDPLAFEKAGETPDSGFDLGQFRHSGLCSLPLAAARRGKRNKRCL